MRFTNPEKDIRKFYATRPEVRLSKCYYELLPLKEAPSSPAASFGTVERQGDEASGEASGDEASGEASGDTH